MGNGFIKQAISKQAQSQIHKRMESMSDYCRKNGIALHTQKADIDSELLSRLSDGSEKVISLIGFDNEGGYLFQSNSLVGIDFDANDKASTFLIALKESGRAITMIQASFPNQSIVVGDSIGTSHASRLLGNAFQEDMELMAEDDSMDFDVSYSDMDYGNSYAFQY